MNGTVVARVGDIFRVLSLLLHPYQVQRFLGPDKTLGHAALLETLGDTVIGNGRWVGADWGERHGRHRAPTHPFGLSTVTGLP